MGWTQKRLLFLIFATSCGLAHGGEDVIQECFIAAKADSIRTELLLANAADRELKGSVIQKVTDSDGHIFLEIGPIPFAIEANSSSTVVASKEGLNPKLWSPESPNLYDVNTTVVLDTNAISRNDRIGFRTFEIRGSHFYLNGKPYFLRGLSRMPPDNVHDSEGKLHPEVWSDEVFIKRFFAALKAANVNTARLSGNISDDCSSWVKYADEMGFLMVYGSYAGEAADSNDVLAINRRIFTPVIKAVRNHPSAIIYTLANELKWEKNPQFLPETLANLKVAKALDSTRPFIANAGFGQGKAGDIEDIHTYQGYYHSALTNYSDLEKENAIVKDGTQPVTFTEMVGSYTNDFDGRFVVLANKHLGNALRLIGTSENFAEDSLWYQSFATKEIVEAMRRARGMDNRICGIFPFSTYWFWDIEQKSFKPKPAIQSLATAYSPILLSLKTWQRHGFAGQYFSGQLYVINDDVALGTLMGAKVRLSLVQGTKTLSVVEVNVPPVEYYGKAKLPVSIPIPEQVEAGPAKIVLELEHSSPQKSVNEVEVFIATCQWAKGGAINRPLYLYDVSGMTHNVLEKADIKCQETNSIPRDPNALLIIGKNSVNDYLAKNVEQLQNFVHNGGRVLVLEHDPCESWVSSILPGRTTIKDGEELFINMDRDLKIFCNDLKHRDYFAWNSVNPETVDCYPVKHVFDIDPEYLSKMAIIANCAQHLDSAAIFEYFDGSGSIIFSQMECVNRYDTDPIAAKAFVNLLAYFSQPNHNLASKAGWEIHFGDFESERGLFPLSLKQGIILNADNFGRVSYGSRADTMWATGWLEGRRVAGQQKISGILGYLSPVHEQTDKAEGFFYINPPDGAKSLYLTVKNPVSNYLWFNVSINGKDVNDVKLPPYSESEYGPWVLPDTNLPLKIIVRAPVDTDETKKSRKSRKYIVNEPIFTKMRFGK